VTAEIIGAAINVHRELGPGLLESAYEQCLAIELRHAGVPFERQVDLPIVYRGMPIDARYRVDLIVRNRVVVEIKAVADIAPVHEAQLLTYLRLTELPVGLLLNFHAPRLLDGIRRYANTANTAPRAPSSPPHSAPSATLRA
jgi:GxxExxY protein